MKAPRRPVAGSAGFTLVELLIVVALVAVVLGLAAPSFLEFIQMQRLRGVNAQLVTDINLARSEAASRNVHMYMRFQSNAGMSCYIVYVSSAGSACDCTAGDGLRCTAAGTEEVRAVQVPTARGVYVIGNATGASGAIDRFAFDPRNGTVFHPNNVGPEAAPIDYGVDAYLDTPRKLRTFIGPRGRVKVCKPLGSRMTETAC